MGDSPQTTPPTSCFIYCVKTQNVHPLNHLLSIWCSWVKSTVNKNEDGRKIKCCVSNKANLIAFSDICDCLINYIWIAASNACRMHNRDSLHPRKKNTPLRCISIDNCFKVSNSWVHIGDNIMLYLWINIYIYIYIHIIFNCYFR